MYMLSLNDLGEVQVDLLEPECATSFAKALTLSKRLGEQRISAVLAMNLGAAFLAIPELRDLDKAEKYFRTSLELRKPDDHRGRVQVFRFLGRVAYERFFQACRENKIDEQLPHLEAALQLYMLALRLNPKNDFEPLAGIHNQLGSIYYSLGENNQSLLHFHKSISYAERQGDVRDAALTTLFISGILMEQNRLPDAQAYAYACLSKLEQYGDRASKDIEDTRKLIAEIEQRMS
jgi:tetratricopeptide (TPR) repeat protein